MISLPNPVQVKQGQYKYNIVSYTSDEWLADDPIIPAGVLAYTTDTNELRLGNGTEKYSEAQLASSGTGIADVPNNAETYIRQNMAWSPFNLNRTQYNNYVLTASDVPTSIKSEWKIYQSPYGYGIASAGYYDGADHTIAYIPTIKKLIALNFVNETSLTTKYPIFVSDDGGETWYVDENVEHASLTMRMARDIKYLPQFDMLLQASVSGSNSIGNYVYLYSVNRFDDDWLSAPLIVNSRSYFVNIIDDEIYSLNENGLDIYNVSSETHRMIVPNNGYTVSQLQNYWPFYCKSKSQYQIVKQDYTKNVDNSKSIFYSLESDYNSWALKTVNRKCHWRNTFILDGLYYAYDTNAGQFVITDDLINDDVLMTIDVPDELKRITTTEWTNVGLGPFHRFDYLPLAKLFYVIAEKNVYLSKDLINWWSKKLPDGIYPARSINVFSRWNNIEYILDEKSIVFVYDYYCGKLDISEIIDN